MLGRLKRDAKLMALDEAARLGFANGAFEDSDEDAAEVVEEFFPEQSEEGDRQRTTATDAAATATKSQTSLR